MSADTVSDADEVPLEGGRANTGRVVRIGDQVARPTYPQTPTVEHFLRHLNATAPGLGPEPLPGDEHGRQRLRFIEGRVPRPPYPAWAFDEGLLRDVARRQRDLHGAAQSYRAPTGAVWAVSAGDYFPAEALVAPMLLVCHNDLGMPNTVVDADELRVAGFIDFDYVRPVDPLFDIAVAARHWVPFGDLDLETGAHLDRVARFAMFCDVHDLDVAQRGRVVALAIAFLDKARHNIRSLADAGQPGFQQLLANGYDETNLATVAWLRANSDAMTGDR